MAADSSIPAKWQFIWGVNQTSTYLNPIPATQSGVAAGQNLGFPAITASPTGTPPNIKDFNGALQYLSAWVNWYQGGGPVAYDATYSTNFGGYPNGAILMSATTVGKFWISLADNNTSNPDAGGGNWSLWPPSSPSLLPLNNTWTGTNQFNQNITLLNGISLSGKDTSGVARQMLTYDGANDVDIFCGTSFFRVLNFLGTAQLVSVDNSGNMIVVGNLNAANIGASAAISAGTTLAAGTSIFANQSISAGQNIAAAGQVNAGGALVAGTQVIASNGNVTASNGYLRASLGARNNPGDLAVGTILNDFQFDATNFGYLILPNGFCLQWGTGTFGNGLNQVTNLPITFPNGVALWATASFAAAPTPDNWVGAATVNSSQILVGLVATVANTVYFMALGY